MAQGRPDREGLRHPNEHAPDRTAEPLEHQRDSLVVITGLVKPRVRPVGIKKLITIIEILPSEPVASKQRLSSERLH